MAINVIFYTFYKKKNSTKQPVSGTTFSCLLKQPTDVINPEIELHTNNPTAFNYAYISDFGGRYYYVTDWTSEVNGIWTALLAVDVLATYRTDILNSYQYVVRNQAKYDLEVPDNMYPMIDGVEFSSTEFTNDSPFTDWVAIFGVAGKGGNPFNGLSYYQTNYEDILTFMNTMFDPNLSPFISSGGYFDVSNDTMKALIQPLQYIPVCYALPYDLTTKGAIATSVSEVPIGFWNMAGTYGHTKRASSQMGSQFYQIWTKTFNLPSRTIDDQPLGTWASKMPYTEYRLFAGPFGQIVLDTSLMNMTIANSVTAVIKGDLYGNCILTLTDGSANILYRGETNVAVDFKLTSLAINRMDQGIDQAKGIMGTIGSVAGGIASGNPVGGIVGGVYSALNTIQNAVHSKFPTPQTTGSVSNNLAQVMEKWRLQTCFHKIAHEDREHFGRPLSQRLQLSDNELSGFTMCANATIEIAGYQGEQEEIISYLNSGFYKE